MLPELNYALLFLLTPVTGLFSTLFDWFILGTLPHILHKNLKTPHFRAQPKKTHIGRYITFSMSALTYNFFFMVFQQIIAKDNFALAWMMGLISMLMLTAPFIFAIGSFIKWRQPIITFLMLDWMGIINGNAFIASMWLTRSGPAFMQMAVSNFAFQRWWSIPIYIAETIIGVFIIKIMDHQRHTYVFARDEIEAEIDDDDEVIGAIMDEEV